MGSPSCQSSYEDGDDDEGDVGGTMRVRLVIWEPTAVTWDPMTIARVPLIKGTMAPAMIFSIA